ncbi:MAG: putative LPS assembly protein LptD, partial [SAR324 cluster bacterium]|nr:putative LPS assembly protein LptD [SAR324 cluster bacterium]
MQLLRKALVMLMGLALFATPALAQLPDRVQIRASGYTLDPATNTLRYQDAIVTYGDLTIEGELLTYDPNQRLITAEGLVRITEGDTIVAGEHLTFNLAERTAIIKQAQLFDLRQGTRLTADRIKRVSETQFQAENCTFTTCDPTAPFWVVEGSTVDYHLENFATATNTLVRIRGVPVFYSPFMAWPTVRKRKSGILPPKLSFTHSSAQRYNLGFRFALPYFWAIDPEHDLTVTPESVANRGSGLKLDYHYAYMQGMRGSLTVQRYFEKIHRDAARESGSRSASSVTDAELRPQRFKLAAMHSQQLDPRSRLSLSGLAYSDSQFQREYESARSQSKKVAQSFSLSVNRQFPSGSATLATTHERVFKEIALLNPELDKTWVQEQPALRYQFGKKLGSYGVSAWESSVGGALIHYERSSGYDGNAVLFDPKVRTHFPVFELFKGSVRVGKR